MDHIAAHDPLRRRRRLPHASQLAGTPLGAPISAPFPPAAAPPDERSRLGYAAAQLPPGSRRLPPVIDGDQGISAPERPHAEVAIRRLFEAGGVDMVALLDRTDDTYELRSRTGSIRWQRWATPTGDVRYVVVAQQGENPIANVDGTILRTLEQELAAAGGSGRPVPKPCNAYPDMFARISQLFDHHRAPEFVYIPGPGGDPNHPGAGSHGIPDIVQSRAPLIVAGPGVARGAVTEQLARHEDVAPTIAELLGVRPVIGTNATGVPRTQLLRWQEGRSLAPAVADAQSGATWGVAQRAIMFAIDGLSQPVLLDEIAKGRLPNFARIMAAGTLFANGALAQYPVVTWANHNTLVTGASPGHTGLVNNSWYDRTTQREQLITDGGFRNVLRTGRFMEPQVETLYEAVERSFRGATTVAINQPSGRGADLSVLDLTGVPKLLANGARIGLHWLRDRMESDRTLEGNEGWKGEAMKDSAATAIGQALWSAKVPPKLGVFEYTLADNRGHHVGPQTDDARRALAEIDRKVGKVLDTLERRGIADSTAIVLTADHGMEHQHTDRRKLGGWRRALERAGRDGVRTVESTRFVYVKSVAWQVESPVPRAGTSGPLVLRVANDDRDARGARPPVGGATVTVRDANGRTWSARTDDEGRVRLDVAPTAGPLQVTIEHADFSVERGSIPVGR